jgi:hypothetical protein
VSSVCGNADGFTKCGLRSPISFKDKLKGLLITVWPYWGWDWNAATSVLTLDPKSATAASVLTASISLVNYSNVIFSQDITSTVSGGLTKTQTPDAPVTSINADGSVLINWTAPSSGGIPITAYTIAIKKSDGSYCSDLVNCDGSNSVILAALSCTIPIKFLKAAPFNLQSGSIYATVIATNLLGSSSESNPGNGAVIKNLAVVATLLIPA